MKSYPAYKNSGVPWLGEIPEHWELERLQWHLEEIRETNSPIRTNQVLSLTNKRGIIPYEEKGNQGNKAKEKHDEYKLAYPDTLVMNSMNVIIGSVGICRYFGCVSPVYYVYKTVGDTDLSYINYIFQTSLFQKELRRHAKGILEIRLRLSSSDIRKCLVPVPPLSEQAAIASYLDRKCGEIDEMVRRRQAIIERLRELKQALIAKAVTKGLQPDVPMKDSGIPWLGQIPEGWEIERLQWHLEEIRETNSPVKTNQVLSLTNKRGIIPYEEKGNQGNKAKEKLDEYKLAYPDTLVMNSMNVIIGSVGICRYFGCVSPVYYVYKTVGNTNLSYINYIFQTSLFQKELRRHAKGILEIRLRLSSSDIRKCLVPVPPLPEQAAIVAYLDKKCAAIDELISRHGQIVEKLKELKASAIAHVVTGKIDIRERA